MNTEGIIELGMVIYPTFTFLYSFGKKINLKKMVVQKKKKEKSIQ